MAQDRGSAGGTANIRVRSDLVLINAVVTDVHGVVVTDLDAQHFHLFEEGNEQIIKYCASEDSPVSIGLILDTSGSMGDKLSAAKKAAVQFVHAANPSDEYFLLEFRDRPRVVVPFTSDTDRLISAIESIEAGGPTALLDAVHLALREIRRGIHPRKALLVISDGMDNHSRYSARETKRLALEVDTQIYTINLWEPPRSGNRYAIQRRDSGLLEEISGPTGGRSFAARDPKKLASVAELISSEIRHEYVLGYVPSNHHTDGGFHQVRLKVESPRGRRLRVSNRAGYYAGTR
jgi:Ca-activated chloride channel family protein